MATEAELLKGAAPQGGNGDTAFMLPMPHSHPLEKKKERYHHLQKFIIHYIMYFKQKSMSQGGRFGTLWRRPNLLIYLQYYILLVLKRH